MSEPLHLRIEDVAQRHHSKHKDYEYYRRDLVKKGTGACAVSHYEVPPGKAAFPYHYHVKNEECFFILSGKGLLKTPTGEKEVSAGEFLFFPADAGGAHKLTNISETENLVYLDFDTTNDLDVCFYPDSEKVGIWGKGIDKLYKAEENVDYYQGE
jgi:Uncharacterized conserved protein, contains double-stranded beta-helix domain